MIEQLCDRILSELRPEIEAALAKSDVETLEKAALATGRRASALVLKATSEVWGTGHAGPYFKDDEGHLYRFHRHGERKVYTRAGVLPLRRAYYRDGQGNGVFPLDKKLGLTTKKTSVGLQEVIAKIGMAMPFRVGRSILRDLTGLIISEEDFRKISEQLGTELYELEERQAEAAVAVPAGVERERKPKRIAMSLDGAMCHVGKMWRETKLGVLHEFDERGKQSGAKRYVARTGTPEELSKPLTLELLRSGSYEAEHLVILGDGAPWIWNLAVALAPDATQILDWYHAVEHVGEVARARFPDNPRARRAWFRMAKARLRHDGVAWLITQVQQAREAVGSAPETAPEDHPAKVLRRNEEYFAANRERMRYGYFRAQGYPIGSGVVESACKTLVQQRMKLSGMRWGSEGARSILAGRAALLSGKWEERRRRARLAA